MDDNLNWKSEISHVANKIAMSIGIVFWCSFFLLKSSLRMLYYSLIIYPYFYYCNIVWASTYKTNLRRLVILKKRIIRVINKSHFNAHTDPIFKDLDILNFNDTHLLQLGQFMYSCRNSVFLTTLRLKRKRPPPTVIIVRNFKQFNTENFKADIEQTPFYIASVFDDMDDIQHGISCSGAFAIHTLH